MPTPCWRLDPASPDPDLIAQAAGHLRAGGLVAFPTETVYGLGANALDAAAVARIFTAKGRPATNPVIVHVADAAAAAQVVAAWPATAERLAKAFWPGPLTLVLPKQPTVPDVVTAGGPTVAVRVPAHPVALALVRAAGVPVAAPSANRSNQLSPTRAIHVLTGLDGRIDLVLDAGPTPGGLESTVLDLTAQPPRLLRPGLIGPAELEAVIGPITRAGPEPPPGPQRSPGQLARHYAPRATLEVVPAEAAPGRVTALAAQGLRVGWLALGPAPPTLPDGVARVAMPADPAAYAARLFDRLHGLDAMGVEWIIAEEPPDGDAWLAVRDRLRRAATPGG